MDPAGLFNRMSARQFAAFTSRYPPFRIGADGRLVARHEQVVYTRWRG